MSSSWEATVLTAQVSPSISKRSVRIPARRDSFPMGKHAYLAKVDRFGMEILALKTVAVEEFGMPSPTIANAQKVCSGIDTNALAAQEDKFSTPPANSAIALQGSLGLGSNVPTLHVHLVPAKSSTQQQNYVSALTEKSLTDSIVKKPTVATERSSIPALNNANVPMDSSGTELYVPPRNAIQEKSLIHRLANVSALKG